MKFEKLGNLTSIQTGKIDVNKAVVGGKYPFFTCSREVYEINDAPFEGKAVLVAGNGDLNVKYYEGKFNAYQRTYFLFVNNENELKPRYLYWFLESYVGRLRTESIGSTIKYIKMGNLTEAEIPLPTPETQREIVEKLDSAFAEIDLLERNLDSAEAKVNQLQRSILDLEYSLEGSKIEPLEKLVDILDNQRIPINATERSHRVGDVPYFGATGQVGTIDKAIFNETLILLGEDGVPFFDPTKHKAYEISGPSWVNNHAHVLRAKPDLVIQRYLLHFLNSFNYIGYVNGATRLKLTQGDMKRIPVPVPDIDVQKKIVSKIDSAFGEISKLNVRIALKRELAKELRQSILSCYFTQEESAA